MDTNGAVDLLRGWAALIGAISWPLVIVFALLFFGRPLRAFLQNLGELRVKVGARVVSRLHSRSSRRRQPPIWGRRRLNVVILPAHLLNRRKGLRAL